MLNIRKLKKDFSPAILKEGKELFEKKSVLSAKIVNLSPGSCRLCCRVLGNFENRYECEIEIDREDSTIIDSDCDCTYKYDCQHLAAVVFYLEQKLDKLVVAYSKEMDIEDDSVDDLEKETLRKTFEEAESKEVERLDKKKKKELLEEYVGATSILGESPFFLPEENISQDKAELLIIFSFESGEKSKPTTITKIQLALRLPNRSKPLNIPNIKHFLNAIKYHEMLYIGNKRFNFSLESFDKQSQAALKILIGNVTFTETQNDATFRTASIKLEIFGTILAKIHEIVLENESLALCDADNQGYPTLSGLFIDSLEKPMRYSNTFALFRVELEYLKSPAPKILINPTIVVEDKIITILEEVLLFECSAPGMIYENAYYRFASQIRPKHLRNLISLRSITIPEPLFGTFVENALPELLRFSEWQI